MRKTISQNFKPSFNIVKLQNKVTSPETNKLKLRQNSDFKTLPVRKTQGNFFSFKAPTHNNFIESLSLNELEKEKSCKLKSLLQLPKNSNSKDTTVVLSVDLILN